MGVAQLQSHFRMEWPRRNCLACLAGAMRLLSSAKSPEISQVSSQIRLSLILLHILPHQAPNGNYIRGTREQPSATIFGFIVFNIFFWAIAQRISAPHWTNGSYKVQNIPHRTTSDEIVIIF